ncbi:MAG TPA: methionine--tRNA ligase [Candidatus Saccharimonadia bacterium]|nr:methionine--tRNA ligase [Candidatus Saccharimonadia bacterium]
MAKFYVTTASAYTNGPPHIGYAMELIQGDVLARYHRQIGDEVWYVTGTDEHGTKNKRSAEEAGKSPKQYVDEMSQLFRDLAAALKVTTDQFVRSTDPAHEKAAQALWKACEKDIYKAKYEGWYCVGCETFYTEIELPDHICPIHKKPLEKIAEENYFFKLSAYTAQIKELISTDKLRIYPDTRKNEILALLEKGLEDISVSRDKKQLTWGVPVPGDPDQVMYVWFDALGFYISALGYPSGEAFQKFWPADVQIVGKDILRHHAAIWPAMLLSAGLPAEKSLFVHGHISSEGHKMSKSLGNVVAPGDVIDKYGVDALRYYLLREIQGGSDGDFSWSRMEQVYNADLANDLGNLVQRVQVMVGKYLKGVLSELPAHSHDVQPYGQAMTDLRFDRALAEVWLLIRGLNQYLEEEKPWELAKTDMNQLSEVLHHSVADLLQLATMLLPFLPTTAQKIAATFAGGVARPEVGLLFPKSDTVEKTTIASPEAK